MTSSILVVSRKRHKETLKEQIMPANKEKSNCNNRKVSKLKAGNYVELSNVKCKAQTQSSTVPMFTTTKNLSTKILLNGIEHVLTEKMLELCEDHKIKVNFETSGHSEYWAPAWTNMLQKLILLQTCDNSDGDFDGKKIKFLVGECYDFEGWGSR